MTILSTITQKAATGTIYIKDRSAILFPINRPEKMINIEREKYALPLPEKKPEEEDVYVYQVTFY